NSLKCQYSSCKAFFVANRSALPTDKFVIKPSRSRIDDLLDPHIVKDLISVADLGMKAFYLTLYQGFLDQERFHIFNLKGAYELATHIKEKGITEPFKISFSGRKGSKNKTPFYTYIGHDAMQAWQQYFDHDPKRGWPKEGEALLLDRNGNPFTKDSLQAHHRRLLTKLGYIKREKNILARYGFGMHNFRDAAVTSVSPHKNEGFEKDTYEFVLGHITDPNGYDKFYREEADVKRKYRIMLPYLNLISEGKAEISEQVKEHAEQMREMEKKIDKMADAIVDTSFSLQAQLRAQWWFHDLVTLDTVPFKVSGAAMMGVIREMASKKSTVDELAPERGLRLSELFELLDKSHPKVENSNLVERITEDYVEDLKTFPVRPEVMKRIYELDKQLKKKPLSKTVA
ncbi:hypothetical protein MUP59_10150, partial [Candidatus Bathyarchaeota archaeon]|nr:hypothetical protein [Candidatus Bathyarchaeota archaeon]